jgi:heme-degrading monooxygenase HmoA
MLKLLRRRLSALGLALVLVFSTLLGYPNLALADKAPKAIAFDPASKMVSIAAIYETTPDTQLDAISSVMKSSKSFYKKAPGFGSFLVLKSEDGLRVVTLSQWKDVASYEAFLTPADASSEKSSKKETSDDEEEESETIAPNKTVTFEIGKVQAPAGVIPSLRGKAALVQFSEIAAKDAADQATVLAAAEQGLVDITKAYPAPKSVVLLRGVDGAEVAVLSNLGYTADEFTDVSKAPTFKLLSEESAALAQNDQHLYEVVAMISPKSKSDGKSEGKGKGKSKKG